MRLNNRLLALLLALLLGIMTLSACSKNTEDTEPIAKASRTDLEEVTITDDAGRQLTIPGPDYLKTVYVTSPIGFIYIYTLALDKLAGTPIKFSEQELEYMNPACAKLPFLGGTQVGKELNREAILDSGTQVIFSITSSKTRETDISTADELQKQLGIPVVIMDGSMDNITNTYTFLGEILGVEKRADELSSYCADVFDNVSKAIETLSDEKRVRVYYAEGSDGLSTEPDTSSHAEVLKYAGAKNVADIKATGGGMSEVSLEQVLTWSPDVIITWENYRGGAYSIIKEDLDWGKLDAVKNGRVYTMPNTPFSWMDRPASVNRFLGIQWVSNLLYPETYDIDIKIVTKEFYRLFYSVELTDAQVDKLVQNAIVN